MTHHITSKTLLDRVRSSRRSFENTRCSWCQTEANYWTSMGEENFVSIQGKTLAGEPAFAVFCPECLKDPAKKDEVKFAFTIDQIGEDFVPAQVATRELREAGEEDPAKWPGNNPIEPPQPSEPTPGPEQTGVPAEEATGSGMVKTRADVETGTRVVEVEGTQTIGPVTSDGAVVTADGKKVEDANTKKKKGLFG